MSTYSISIAFHQCSQQRGKWLRKERVERGKEKRKWGTGVKDENRFITLDAHEDTKIC